MRNRRKLLAVLGVSAVLLLAAGFLGLRVWLLGLSGKWDTNYIQFENQSQRTLPRVVLLIPDSQPVADFHQVKPGQSVSARYDGMHMHCCELYCELPNGTRQRLETVATCGGGGKRIGIVYRPDGQFVVDGQPATPAHDPVEYLHLPP